MPTAAPALDPRKIITPESFSVAPHLLGLPLASPSRRLAAILVDLLLVSIVANVGGSVLFGLTAAAAFFWFATRKLGRGGTFFGRSARMGFRVAGGVILFLVAIKLWHRASTAVEHAVGDEEEPAVQASVGGGRPKKVTPLGALAVVREMNALGNATDSAGAHNAAVQAAARLRRMGVGEPEIREALNDVVTEHGAEKPFMAAALAGVLPADTVRALPADSLAARYAAALAAHDTLRAGALRPKLASVLARDSLSQLHSRVQELESDRRDLRQKLKKEEKRGLLATLLGFFDDLGIGLGWTGLYFTAFTALLKGQTPGKKLLGICVLRLDGEPMTLWASFERFGGYAAGLFTGLSGYAQVYWDRNRQAIQDKISETVVIRATGPIPQAPHTLRPRPAAAAPLYPAAGTRAP